MYIYVYIVYIYIYVYIVYTETNVYTITISEIRGHEFGREWGVVFGRVWRKERGGGSVGIILKLKKEIKLKKS